jgi:hypothetical protein
MEQPFAGRLRASLELRYRSDRIGEPDLDEYRIRELRAEASLAWAPHERWFLVALAPFVSRSVMDSSLAEHELTSAGDVEVRAKGFFYKDRTLAPRLLLAGIAGLKFPTAPWRRDQDGERLPFEAQPGTGSWDVLLGLSAATFRGDWSGYASAHAAMPFATREPFEPGATLRATLAVQYQLAPWIALRPALDARADAITRESGREEPNSGGFIAFGGGDVLVSPFTDWTLTAGVRAPFWNALRGEHHEGLVGSAGIAADW